MKIATSLAFLIVFASTPASAQSADAETLFREGKRLIKRGEVAEACEKFEASERLEPSLGTELNLADCRERNGQLASAWAVFVKATAAAKRADDEKREAEARRRAAALESQLVYLTIVVADDHRVEDLVIKRNGAAIDAALWNQRVPVDADSYTISAEAPGFTTWTETVTVKTKNKKVEVPRLERSERKASRRKRPAAGADEGEEADEVREAAERPIGSPRRFTGLAIAVGAVGLGAIGAGVYFGLHGNDLQERSDALCPTTKCTDPEGVDLNKRARRDALFANVGLIAGGAAVVGAIVLIVVGSPEDAERVTIGPMVGGDRAGFALGGRF